MKTPIIVGAGLAGLIAGHAWRNAHILEAAPEPRESHKALLRFRSEAVAHMTGVEFERVRVHKGIFSEGAFHKPNILLANLYSKKVLDGHIRGDRSIWNLDPVDRWIAPENLHERLLEGVSGRLTFDSPMDFSTRDPFVRPVVNTAPLPVVLNQLKLEAAGFDFERSSVQVMRWRLEGCKAYQTIYFPDPQTRVYRASITGDLLIVELVAEASGETRLPWNDYDICDLMAASFGVDLLNDGEKLASVEQKYGKIVSLPDAQRRAILYKLTSEHKIYSLGRFATWKNILLDDVVEDIAVIQRLMKTNGDQYELLRRFS